MSAAQKCPQSEWLKLSNRKSVHTRKHPLLQKQMVGKQRDTLHYILICCCNNYSEQEPRDYISLLLYDPCMKYIHSSNIWKPHRLLSDIYCKLLDLRQLRRYYDNLASAHCCWLRLRSRCDVSSWTDSQWYASEIKLKNRLWQLNWIMSTRHWRKENNFKVVHFFMSTKVIHDILRLYIIWLMHVS